MANENQDSTNSSEPRTLGFVTLSSIAHAALFAAILMLNLDSRHEKHDVTTVEILSPKGEQQQITPLVKEEKSPEAQLPQPAEKEVQAAVAPPVEKVQTLPAKKEMVQAPAPASKTIATKLPSAVRSAKQAPPQQQVVAIAPTPTNDDSDVATPVLDEPQLEKPDAKALAADAKLKDNDVDEDLEKVDNETDTKVAAVDEKLNKESEDAQKANDQEIENLKKQNQEEANRMAVIAAENKAKNKAAGDKLAQENATRDKAAALAAAAAAEGERAEKAQKEGGAGSPAQNIAGATETVRSLEELRQVPGNHKPEYDSEDRLRQRQGEVSILAYVSKEGLPTQFKMVKSTGHRTLDLKTLKALKTWKFYPGQEGWVEIPFKWDLKGGPQEMPATLRRKVSQY